MDLAAELERLERLRAGGALSDEEFARAKGLLLQGGGDGVPPLTLDQATRQWSQIVHFTQLAGVVVPGLGWILPIVLWQVKKVQLPGVDVHGRIVTNWILSAWIYLAGSVGLAFAAPAVGIGLAILVGLLGLVFAILGGMRAGEGKPWVYPLSIQFFSVHGPRPGRFTSARARTRRA